MQSALQKWKERLKYLYLLPLSNKSLKYFPPDFTIRDPIVSMIKQYRRKGQSIGMLLFYMEEFHHLFATHPYPYIQNLQKLVREKLLEILPRYFQSSDLLGIKQFASDDFCMFIKEYPGFSFDDLQRKALLMRQELEQSLRIPMRPKEDTIYSFQIGCHIIEMDIENTEAAIRSSYHYALAIATKKLPAHFSKSRQELLDIIELEKITVLAQPIMSLNSGEIFGWEILTRGPLNSVFHTPTELFDFAYQADLLSKMEFIVMKKAFEEISKRGIGEQVFINVTPVTLCHPLFLNQLLTVLSAYDNISASQIILEITERHSIRDFAYMGALMAHYRSHGFRFAVDDAGAGYSSLQSISELIPDIIKIDKSVIQNIDQLVVKQYLLRALLLFAENINCQVIAEGIESQGEADILYEMHVHMGQGFYFARPEPIVAYQERMLQCRSITEKIQQNRQICSVIA
ncbi:EAL domain-containing protein [Paenibacillus periandrae]|uniref:EAL domain-containing protein n=1 Tax=Paenibacillus periandrae TaxID=1761741 RepID=UPI001F092A54|nr:EAL domain-containing protein [Paenibacillus periandrae]